MFARVQVPAHQINMQANREEVFEGDVIGVVAHEVTTQYYINLPPHNYPISSPTPNIATFLIVALDDGRIVKALHYFCKYIKSETKDAS